MKNCFLQCWLCFSLNQETFMAILYSHSTFFCDGQSDVMLNTSYLLYTVKSLEILVILWWLHTLEILSKTNYETKFWYKQFHKIHESVKLLQSMKIGPNDWDDSTLSFYRCQMFNIYDRKIQHSGALMLLFNSISMWDLVYTFSTPVQYWIHNFQGTMFAQTNVSALIIDKYMYIQKCTPFSIVLYKTKKTNKQNRRGLFYCTNLKIKYCIYYL